MLVCWVLKPGCSVSPWHHVSRDSAWRGGQGSQHPAQRHLWTQKRQSPAARCCPVPGTSDTLLWLSSGEWTHKVALGSGLFAQPLDSHLSWHPASLSPEPPHPSKSNGHD